MKRIRLLVATAALAVVGALSAPAAAVSAGPDPARISGIRRPADPAATPILPTRRRVRLDRRELFGHQGSAGRKQSGAAHDPLARGPVGVEGRPPLQGLAVRGTDFNSEGGRVAEVLRRTGYTNMLKSAPGPYNHVYSSHWCTTG
jgi:hypothetical protein